MDASSSAADAGFFTIREVCQELGVTLRTLRFYEVKDLIAPKREPRRRFYYTTDVERLRSILKLKSVGLSLREIREVLQSPGDGPYGLNANLCEEAFKRLSAQRAEAEAGLAFLADAGCRCSTTSAGLYSRPRTQGYEPGMARETYYRRMAHRYRKLAAESSDLEMVEGWRALADECDKLANEMNASPPKSRSMQRQPMQQQQQRKGQDET